MVKNTLNIPYIPIYYNITKIPNRNNKLIQLNNVIVTPHIAGSTIEAYRKGATMAVDEVRRVLSGEKPLNPVFQIEVP